MEKIALCLITKNAAPTIERLLDSIRPFVDGIFVYDTGSTDDTVELLEKLNETIEVAFDITPLASEERVEEMVPLAPIVVERGEWRDDFSWAREQSFAMPDESFTFLTWADDDDVIEGGGLLRHLAENLHPELDGLIFFYDYARDDTGQCVCQLWRERLIRRSAGYEWLNPVHEVLVPPGRPANLAMVPAEQIRYVHHRPPDRGSPTRNLEILLAEKARLEEAGEPVSPRTLAYLGTELMSQGQWADAIGYLDAYIMHPEAVWNDERSQVHHKLAICLRALGNPHAAVEIEMRSLKERDDWAETYVGLAQSFAQLQQWPRAEREAKRALQLGVPQTPLIVNPLEFTLIPWLTIAEACVNTGRSDEALHAVHQALALAPTNEHVRVRTVEIRRLAQENEIVGALMLLRETLVRHDENEKAYWLLERAVPYVVGERQEILTARAAQREMVRHMTHPEEYERWYRDEPKESTVGDEVVENVGDYIPRAKRLLEGLQEQETALGRKPRLLDLGCNDGWIACYLWTQAGFVTDGIELNKQSVAKGLKRLKKFGAPGVLHHGSLFDAKRILNGKRYDAVSLFEVLEHVPDVDEVLDLMEQLLKPDGVIYISTPNGAYERGLIDDWARVERKGHLRAIPVHDLTEELVGRGEITELELQHDDRVTFVGYKPAPRKDTITFYAGAGWEPWSPASIDNGGLGGSETALSLVAIHLAKQGHPVKVYSGAEPGLIGGVLFRTHTAWDPTEEVDLLVVSRMPHVFDNPVGARQTALWCHDHSYPGLLTEERAAKIDHVVTLSEWQSDRFARLYPFLEGKLRVIRNGIRLERDGETRYPDAERPFADRKPRCVYSSSADRGLDVMLEMWPRIREQVPDAELHVFYGWDVFDRIAMFQPHLHGYKARVNELAIAAGGEDGGVFFRGRTGQLDLAREMMEARVWTYPTAFLETSCIGAMEARAAGLALVTSDLGALKETVGEHGDLIPWAWEEDEPHNQTPEYQDAFVETVVRYLSNGESWPYAHTRARRGVDLLDWKHRIAEWEALAAPAKPKRATRAKAAA